MHLADTRIIIHSNPGPPGKPTGPLRIIKVTRNMLALHWSPPYDGSAYQIERYIIEKKDGDSAQWIQAGVCSPDVTAYCVTDLMENQLYNFRIKAETSSGFSEPLEMEGPIVPKRVFGWSSITRSLSLFPNI